jgi:hypothetical protein
LCAGLRPTRNYIFRLFSEDTAMTTVRFFAQPPEPDPEPDEPDDFGDLDDQDMPCTDHGDSCWDAFIPDDDERDPEPDPGDFWIEGEGACLVAAWPGHKASDQYVRDPFVATQP